MIGAAIMDWIGCILIVCAILALFNEKGDKHGKDKICV